MIKNNIIDDDDEDDDEYIKKLKKSLNLIDNVGDSDNDDDLNNYKLNNELVELANEDVSSTPNVEGENDINNKKKINFDDDYDDDCCLLPEFDWANLEAKLKEESKEREYLSQQKSDRDEIRRKLATDTDDDDYIPDYLKKGNNSKSHLGQNLQICFMNESISDTENELDKEQQVTLSNSSSLSSESNDKNSLLKRFVNNSTSSFDLTSKNENLFAKQIKLQQETKQALEIAQREAKLRVELEQLAKKPSPLADIVGLATYGVKRLDKRTLNNMNNGKLQLIENDLRNQIEKTNEGLKLFLIERDELYMQQDSILVDIEDLTKRLQDCAQRLNTIPKMENDESLKLSNQPQIKQSKSSSEIMNLNANLTRLNKLLPNISSINSITNKLYRFAKKS